MPNKASWPQWDHGSHDFKEHAFMLKLSMNTMLKMIDEGQKPPMDEVAAALRAAVAFAERANDEPKIQTVLDEVRKLAIDSSNRDSNMEEKITHIKHQAASLKQYIDGQLRQRTGPVLDILLHHRRNPHCTTSNAETRPSTI
ncbi:hypothetical protein HO173_003350 [Letharia columbiana]|uniref:Uncharacterized protein n=1 Tax=Letharia columbiana TaxID=112416 RepID=A0A8H6L7Y1_9LECA|nr:uncharacterized protein HO173_003350 [Letharia columbiana]KAF6238843.1 hypothetical protein HO173_003350 [Letharia columbiana]